MKLNFFLFEVFAKTIGQQQLSYKVSFSHCLLLDIIKFFSLKLLNEFKEHVKMYWLNSILNSLIKCFGSL